MAGVDGAEGVCSDPTTIPFSFPPSREQCLQLWENHHCQLEIRVSLGSSAVGWGLGEKQETRGYRDRQPQQRQTLLTQ